MADTYSCTANLWEFASSELSALHALGVDLPPVGNAVQRKDSNAFFKAVQKVLYPENGSILRLSEGIVHNHVETLKLISVSLLPVCC